LIIDNPMPSGICTLDRKMTSFRESENINKLKLKLIALYGEG